MRLNSYQRAKARKIAAMLRNAQREVALSDYQLARAVSLMSDDQWRGVAFAAGMPVADIEAKQEVLRILRGKVDG